MPDAESQEAREKRALELAEQRGRRQQVVDSRLDDHERQLKQVKGSIDGFSDRLGALERIVGESAAVARELAKKTLDNRTFFVGVALVLVAVIGLFLSSGGH
jgi:hypothetical protein